MNKRFALLIMSALVGLMMAQPAIRAQGQDENASAGTISIQQTEGRITEIRLHRGWASVMRRVEVTMFEPRVEVQVANLPDSMVTDSLHVEIAGDAARQVFASELRIVSVPDERGWRHEKERLRSRCEELAKALNTREGDSEKPVHSMSEQASSFEAVQFDALLQKLDELESRGPLLKPAARISIMVSDEVDPATVLDSSILVNLTYVVTGADWMPVYTLRTTPESSTASLETDVLVGQQTGEDWADVALLVSSAPGRMSEWKSMFARSEINVAEGPGAGPRAATAGAAEPATEKMFDTVVGDGSVFLHHDALLDWDDSPTVERRIPGRVTVVDGSLEPRNDARKGDDRSVDSARIRFRLDSFRFRCDIRYVGIPVVSQQAFLIGTVRNVRDNYLLPGAMSLFRDSEYAGELVFPGLAPSETLDVVLGSDSNLLVHRRELDRRNRKTGLLGDGRETQIDYRLSILNRTGRDLPVELWDQIPVAGDDRISITVSDPSKLVSTKSEYVETQRPKGLLRWDIDVPASGAGPATPTIIDYTLVIGHHKDVQPDWIPKP